LYSIATAITGAGTLVGVIGGIAAALYWFDSITLQLLALLAGLVFSGVCKTINQVLIAKKAALFRRQEDQEDIVLPVFINNVIYQVAGEDAYEGDLIIAPKAIYYFPHTDLIARRKYELFEGSAAEQNAPTKPQVSSEIIEGAAEQSVEERIDAHIEYLRENRVDALLYETLPLPMRFPRTGIGNMRLEFGRLEFYANLDNHEFYVGNDWMLEGALKSGSYLA